MTDQNLETSPPSEGRALTRAQLAWGMKQAGISLSEIAEELNLETTDAAYALLQEQFTRDSVYFTASERMALLALEMARLETVIAANWPSMLMADAKSADTVLKAIALQIKLGKLDTPDSSMDKTQILVISGQETEYIEGLRKMADG